MKLQNLNIESIKILVSPEKVKARVPLTAAAARNVAQGRQTVRAILDGRDQRLLMVVGPCSIHDPVAALDYARRLKRLSQEVADTLFIVMRVYFEKPRTVLGWKGLINDPHLDGSFDIQHGLILARRLLQKINQLGLACGTEALDPVTPQYLSDLIVWAAIGARTIESQVHREMASGLSMPVGFKNGTDGSLLSALAAMRTALHPHHFLGVNQQGQTAVVHTKGNRYGHLVLRGGGGRQNYGVASVRQAGQALKQAGLRQAVMADCSHANSSKDYRRQPLVLRNLVQQARAGVPGLVGAMVESNLNAGHQPIPRDLRRLKYGVSVTDACVDWTTTERMLREAHAQLTGLRRGRRVRP